MADEGRAVMEADTKTGDVEKWDPLPVTRPTVPRRVSLIPRGACCAKLCDYRLCRSNILLLLSQLG